MGKLEGGLVSASLLQRHGQKLVALVFWAALLVSYFWYGQSNGVNVQAGLISGRTSSFAPLLYILLYLIRPLIFFPASLLSIAGGLFFGPVGGIVYTTIGANLSALVAYLVGHYFGRGVLDPGESTHLVQRYANRMRQHSFDTVLIMRLLLLPYDLVNYLSGFLRIDWKAFLLATVIGSFPATVSLVLIGVAGDLDDLAAGKLSLNPWALAGSVAMVSISLLISRYLRRSERRG